MPHYARHQTNLLAECEKGDNGDFELAPQHKSAATPRQLGKGLHRGKIGDCALHFNRRTDKTRLLPFRSDELCSRYSDQQPHGGIQPCCKIYRRAPDRARCRTPGPNDACFLRRMVVAALPARVRMRRSEDSTHKTRVADHRAAGR
jgi:hypothetical protein